MARGKGRVGDGTVGQALTGKTAVLQRLEVLIRLPKLVTAGGVDRRVIQRKDAVFLVIANDKPPNIRTGKRQRSAARKKPPKADAADKRHGQEGEDEDQ